MLLPLLRFEQLTSKLESTQKLLDILPDKIHEKWAQAGISYGICNSAEQDTPSKCLSQADKRMYLQKEQHRTEHNVLQQ